MAEHNRDAHGKRVTDTATTNRLRFVDKYYVNSQYNADKSLRNAMWTIATLSDKLNVSELIKERAAEIYRKAYNKNAVRGRSTRWLATAALMYACKERGIARSANDFVNALEPPKEDNSYYTYYDSQHYYNSRFTEEVERTGRKDLFLSYKILIQVLDLPIPSTPSPKDELGRIATLAGISERSVRKAMKLYDMLKEHNKLIFDGKSPQAISVCILYIATKYCNESVKQDVITESGQISTVTLRKRCDEYIGILKRIDPNMPDAVYEHRTNAITDRDEFDDLDNSVDDYVPLKNKEDSFNKFDSLDTEVREERI